MKNIELLHQALKLNESPEVENLIKRFILSNDEVKKEKLNLFAFCGKKDQLRDSILGIHHSEGYKYATNLWLAVKVKSEYNPEFEGKIIDAKMQTIDEKYPNINGVIPKDEQMRYIPFNFSRILKIEKEFKLDKKAGIKVGYIEIEGIRLAVEQMALIARFALNFGITEIGLNSPEKAVKVGKGNEATAILMPMMFQTGICDSKIYQL